MLIFRTGTLLLNLAWEIVVRYSEINNAKGVSVLDDDNSNLTIGKLVLERKYTYHNANDIRAKSNQSKKQPDS